MCKTLVLLLVVGDTAVGVVVAFDPCNAWQYSPPVVCICTTRHCASVMSQSLSVVLSPCTSGCFSSLRVLHDQNHRLCIRWYEAVNFCMTSTYNDVVYCVAWQAQMMISERAKSQLQLHALTVQLHWHFERCTLQKCQQYGTWRPAYYPSNTGMPTHLW